VFAQTVPQGMKYQAVARDAKGNILAEQQIGLRINLTSASSTIFYSETHTVNTSQLGLFTLVLGEGTVTKGKFAEIPWSSEDIWMEVSIRDKGRLDFITISNSRLLAVPYAFHAATASQLTNRSARVDDGLPALSWQVTGNSKSNPLTDKLGTTDLADLVIVTNNIERLRVLAGGNVEISNSLKIGANLNVDSSANLNRIGGSTINYGPFTVERTSPTLLSGTLTVDKATDLNSTLNVDGPSDLNSRLNVNNLSPTKLTGTLTVDSTTDLNNKLNVNRGSATSLTGRLRVDSNAVFKQQVLLDNADSNSRSTSTGALVVNGGVGIGKNLNVGGDAAIGGGLQIGGILNLTNETQSTDTATGALKVAGGVGIRKNLNVGGITNLGGQVTINGNLPQGSESVYNDYPLKVEGGKQGIAIKVKGSRQNENNFISFWDENSSENWGRIEGEIPSQFTADPQYTVNQVFLAADLTIAAGGVAIAIADEVLAGFAVVAASTSSTGCVGLGACITVPIPSLIVQSIAEVVVKVATIVTQTLSLGKAIAAETTFNDFKVRYQGVTYQSGAGDYAEWLPKKDKSEKFFPGDIVAIKDGYISKSTEQFSQLMIISSKPIVLGNMPREGHEADFEKVAFMGQVPTKVLGSCKPGDYILPSGFSNGIAKAVAPGTLKAEDYKKIIGVAWSGSDKPGINFINVAVGLNANDLSDVISKQQQEITELKGQITNTHSILARLVPGFKEAAGIEHTHEASIATASNRETTIQSASSANTSEAISATGNKQALPKIAKDVNFIKPDESNIVYYQISQEQLNAGFEMAKQIYKESGVDVEKHPFFEKIKKEPLYKQEVLKKIQTRFDKGIHYHENANKKLSH
jgi:hypothetical protein